MTRTRLLIGAMALIGTACVFEIPAGWVHSDHVTWDGREVEERDGVFTVDDIELKHHRWVTVSGTVDDSSGSTIELRTATGTIDVVSSGTASYELDVLLHSEMEGDGEVLLEAGRLVTRSVGDYMLFINEIRGQAPEGVDLRIGSGRGSASISGFAGGREIRMEVGMGGVRAQACKVSTLVIDAGMGEVSVEGVQGRELGLDAGMGNVDLLSVHFDHVDSDVGMGNAQIRDSTIDSLVVDLGMGNLRLIDTVVGHLEADAGMGNVSLEGDSPPPETMDLDLGVGNLILR